MPDTDAHWYCLRGEPKREHIAAANLRAEEIEAFCPRFTYAKPMRGRGVVPVTEALFPCYLFARFELTQLDIVKRTRGVVCVVKFGADPVAIPDFQIERLREAMGFQDVAAIATQFTKGQTIEVRSGLLAGQTAVVLSVNDSARRVVVLTQLLGQPHRTDLSLDSVFSKPQLATLAA